MKGKRKCDTIKCGAWSGSVICLNCVDEELAAQARGIKRGLEKEGIGWDGHGIILEKRWQAFWKKFGVE